MICSNVWIKYLADKANQIYIFYTIILLSCILKYIYNDINHLIPMH